MNGTPVIEPFVLNAVEWLRLIIEVIGAIIIASGSLIALIKIFIVIFQKEQYDFNEIRLLLARYLTLALEFNWERIFYLRLLRPVSSRSANWL